jgi:hypothetical protein
MREMPFESPRQSPSAACLSRRGTSGWSHEPSESGVAHSPWIGCLAITTYSRTIERLAGRLTPDAAP